DERRLRRRAVGAHRRLLSVRASGNRSTRRDAGAQANRISGSHEQTVEGPLMEDTHVHALDYLSVVRRRARWLLVPIVSSVVVGLLLVRFLPKEYRSSATLSVAAPDVSLNLVNQAQALDNEERLRAITQQLMSPEILARVAKEEGLVGTSVDA